MLAALRRRAAILLMAVMTLGLAAPAWALGGCAYGHESGARVHAAAAMQALHAMHGAHRDHGGHAPHEGHGAHADHADHHHADHHHAGRHAPPPAADCGDHCAMVMHCLAACLGGALPAPGAAGAAAAFTRVFDPAPDAIPSDRDIPPEPYPPRTARM